MGFKTCSAPKVRDSGSYLADVLLCRVPRRVSIGYSLLITRSSLTVPFTHLHRKTVLRPRCRARGIHNHLAPGETRPLCPFIECVHGVPGRSRAHLGYTCISCSSPLENPARNNTNVRCAAWMTLQRRLRSRHLFHQWVRRFGSSTKT